LLKAWEIVILVVRHEPGVDSAVRTFCERKLTDYLNARGFGLDPNEHAELTVCVIKAAQIRKPVRSAKVRIAAKLSAKEGAGPVLLGIADGIVSRPDLSSGVRMPKSSYLRATQYAVSKLMDQLSNISKSGSFQP
jgi:hypothetical protein